AAFRCGRLQLSWYAGLDDFGWRAGLGCAATAEAGVGFSDVLASGATASRAGIAADPASPLDEFKSATAPLLHSAGPSPASSSDAATSDASRPPSPASCSSSVASPSRSEEHTSELQSPDHLV